VETAGSGGTPGNNGDTNYAGSVGVGGVVDTAGQDGYVVITFNVTQPLHLRIRGNIKIRGNVKFR
jgi:hypothetical protein